MTLKASRGLGIVAVYQLVLCILLAAQGDAWLAGLCGGFAGFFIWGTLEALDEGD
jgi:hypothetical protein